MAAESGDLYNTDHESNSHLDQEIILQDENFIQKIGQFYNQPDLSDVKLKVGSTTYFGHRFVLAKSSDVLSTMLYSNNWIQSSLPEITLEETEECQKYFDRFLRYLYTAEVKIHMDSAVAILLLADKYGVASLKNLCTRFMVEHASSPLISNALNWYSWSKVFNLKELMYQCLKTIAWNAEKFLTSSDWQKMDMDFVSQLLKNSDIVIQNEYNLFKALLHWLESEERIEHFHAYAKELLPLIRFPQMQAKELLLVEQNDLYQDKELRPLLKKLTGKAYRFHVLCPHQTELVVSFAQDFYQPRNYLDLAVDNVHIQRNMRDAAEIDVKIYGGLAFLGSYDGDWKVYYKKYREAWVVNTQCYKTASQVGAAQVQCALIITNKDDQVLQVKESEVTVSARGAHLSVHAVLNMDLSKSMAVLFKPIPK